MLKKGAVRRVKQNSSKQRFSSTLSQVEKADGENRPMINLKDIHSFIPNIHFKIEDLRSLKFLLQENCLLCKVNLEDAYFPIPLHESSKKFARFLWPGILYELLCLQFDLVPTPRIFTKLLKVPMTLSRRINMRLVIYLDDIFWICLINLKKSVHQSSQQTQLLAFIIDKKIQKVKKLSPVTRILKQLS